VGGGGRGGGGGGGLGEKKKKWWGLGGLGGEWTGEVLLMQSGGVGGVLQDGRNKAAPGGFAYKGGWT